MTYVLVNLFWTIAGLTVGYYLGRAGRPTESETAVPEHHHWRAGMLGARLFGVFLIILAILSVVTAAVVLSAQQRYIDRQTAIVACQNDYNRRFAETLTERNEAAAREREGQRQLLQASMVPRDQRDPQAVADAYAQYLAILAEADAQRNANPLPVQAC